MVWYRIRYYSL